MKKLVCININKIFSHHRQLKVGEIYFLNSIINGSFEIYNLDGYRIGLYSSDLFIDYFAYNRNNKINKLFTNI